MATFGNTGDNSSFNTVTGDRIFLAAAHVSVGGTIRSLSARMWLASASTQSMRGVLYSDVSGAPGTLLATTDDVAFTNTSESEVTANFTGLNQINVVAGTDYWLGIHFSAGSPNVLLSRNNVTNATRLSSSVVSFSGGTPSTVTTTTSAGPVDMYITYDTDSVTTSYTTQYSPSVYGQAGYSVPTFSGVSFATARSGNGNVADTSFTGATINSDAVGRTNLYTGIFRAIIIFDTTALPTDAVVTGARIIVSGTSKFNQLGSSDLYVVGVNSGGVYNIINSDYQNVQGTSFGSVTYAGFNAAGSNTITLNSNGLAAITAGQYSKYAFRTGFDFLNTSPTWSGAQSTGLNMNGATAKLEIDYDITTTTRNQTGVAKIIGTYQKNQTGTATIAGQYELAGWGFSVPGITYWGDSPIAIQDVSTSQDQTGKARITASTSKTQTGVARIEVSTSQTQTGKSRIAATTQKTQRGLARITATTTQTQTGLARIEISTTQTQSGLARITQTTAQDQDGVAKIQNADTVTDQIITGVARITTVVSKTQTGIARIEVTTTKTITGLARIALVTQQNITGVARIQYTTTKDQTGIADIQKTTNRDQNGVARIQYVTQRSQNGVSRINVTVEMTQHGLARVETTITSTQTGKAAIVNSSSRIQTGIARITVATQQNQTGQAAISVETNQTITGKARIGFVTTKTISGVARIDNPTIGNGAYIPQFPGEGNLDEADNPDSGAYIPQFGGAGSLEEAGTPDEGAYIPQFPTEGELK